ncbi:MAG: hypothetical protein O2793_17665 [Proteobacteria bacterium]|nr:hypothetical protein [Pseudomonadota bacterium]
MIEDSLELAVALWERSKRFSMAQKESDAMLDLSAAYKLFNSCKDSRAEQIMQELNKLTLPQNVPVTDEVSHLQGLLGQIEQRRR